MSYESERTSDGLEVASSSVSSLNSQTDRFINPTLLTLLVSVVLHLLVYKFGFPSLKFNIDSGKREVSIVELTPSQQSRLPNFSPQLDRPEVPNLPLDTPAPPFALPRSLTPGIGDFPNLPPVNIPPPPNFNIPPLTPPPITNIQLPPIGDLSSLPLPPPLESFDVEIKPSEPETPAKPPETPPPPESEEPKAPPPVQESKEPESEKPQVTAKPQLSPQEIAAQRQQNLQQEIRSISSSLQKRESGTTDEDARKNYISWLSEVKEIKPEAIQINGTYPRDACIRRLEGTSVYGVVVDSTGKVVALDLIKGDKYPIFNQQASKDISSQIFNNNTEKPKPYKVTVDYKYDSEICPSLTLPSLRRDNEQQSDTTKPEATPQPTTPPVSQPVTAPKPSVVQPQSATPPKPSLRNN
ncbi:MAG: energy transducer TonB [Pleurocapsa sp.]